MWCKRKLPEVFVLIRVDQCNLTMVSLMQYRAALGFHNIHFKSKEYSSGVKGHSGLCY